MRVSDWSIPTTLNLVGHFHSIWPLFKTKDILQSRFNMKHCVGIVRESYTKWERRSPLCPHHVKALIQEGIQVIVQPSTTRIFTDEEYRRVGATVSDDLQQASLIVGVKQIPAEKILPEKTYMFFR